MGWHQNGYNSAKLRIVEISARVGAQLIWLQVLTKPIKCCNSGVKDSDYSFKKVERRSDSQTEIKIHSPDSDLCACVCVRVR